MRAFGSLALLWALASLGVGATCQVQVPDTCVPDAALFTGSQEIYDRPGGTRTTGGTPNCGSNTLGDGRVDASTAEWAGVPEAPLEEPIRWGNYQLQDMCWHGGHVRGGWARGATWDETHFTRGLRVHSDASKVEGVCIDSIGDGVSIKWGLYEAECATAAAGYWKQGPPTNCETDPAPVTSFTLRHAYLRDIRDDAIEGDYLPGGLVENVLIDGAFTAFGFRTHNCDWVSDGRDRVLAIRDSLVWLEDTVWEPTLSRYEHGQFFKWPTQHVDCNPPLGNQDCNDPTTEDCSCPDKGLKLSIRDSHFRVDTDNSSSANTLKMPTAADGTPKLVDCANNVVTWLGNGGPYTGCPAPAPLHPDPSVPCDLQHWNDAFAGCFTFKTDKGAWNDARHAWLVNHGCTCESGCTGCEGGGGDARTKPHPELTWFP